MREYLHTTFVSSVFLHLRQQNLYMHQKLYPISVQDYDAYVKCEMHVQKKNLCVAPRILGLSLSLYQRYCFDFKKRALGTRLQKSFSHDFMNFKNKLKIKFSYTESFVNKILKSAPKVDSFKCLRLSRFMYGNINLVKNRRNVMFTLTKVTFYPKKSK